MSFQQEGHNYTFKGITTDSSKIINSHCMENLLKRGHSSIVAQFHSIQAFETASQPLFIDMYLVLSKRESFFKSPQGLPPSCGVHDHSIMLIPSRLPTNIFLYRHPFFQTK